MVEKMKKFTFGYIVNDSELFREEVLSKATSDMVKYDKDKPYTAFAISAGDEFARLEAIEDAINNGDLSLLDRVDLIAEILGKTY